MPVDSEAADLRFREKPPHQYSIMKWTIDDGLPEYLINDILQTSDRYLWIATERGVSRFDGVTFSTIDRATHPNLLSNRISCLLEDSNGNVWFGTKGGGLYTISGDSLSRFTDDMGLPTNFVNTLAEDSTGSIWVGTDGEGLGRILPDTIITYSENAGLNRHVNIVRVDHENVLWIGTLDGLYHFKNDSLSVFPGNDSLPSRNVRDIYHYKSTTWIATAGGLVVIQKGVIEDIPVTGGPTVIESVIRDNAGNLWIGTQTEGVYKKSPSSTSRFLYHEPSQFNRVASVYSDREGNIWMGLERIGLVRLRDEVFTTYSTLDGLADNTAFSVTEGEYGHMWIGTLGGLTSLRVNEVKNFLTSGRTADKVVTTVCVDREKVVWLGTISGQLMKMEDEEPVSIELLGSDGIPIWVIYTDSKGALWVGTARGLYHLQNGQIRHYKTHYDELTNDDVRAIVEDQHGNIWIGTSYGLNKFADGKFIHYTDEKGLTNPVIVSLYTDDDSDLWVGTLGGLWRLRNGQLSEFSMEHGLPDEQIGTILEDDQGNLWIGSQQGISRIEKLKLNEFLDGSLPVVPIKVFGREEGMRSARMRITVNPSGWKAHDGTLWFATNEGIATVDPSVIESNPVAPPVHIVSMRVDRSIMRGLTPEIPVEVGTAHNEIEIMYSAPTFVNPAKTIFRYKLEGLNTDWVDAGIRRSAFFSSIPPGHYTFRVIAANEDGVWNETGASLALVVQPPYWMTWWFRSIIIILFLSIGPAVYFRRISRLQKKHSRQEEFSRRLLASQEEERKRIAAELHDSLGQNIIIMKNRALLGKKAGADTAMVSEQFDEIVNTATATLEEMRKVAHNLRPLHLERFGLTETIAHTVNNVGASTGIDLQATLDPVDNILPSDVEIHLFRIIQEALTNIVKHAGASAASITTIKRDGLIEIVIKDNGRGFTAGEDTRKKGIGFDDIAQRVNLCGGRLTIDSFPGKGTTLNVILPVQRKDHEQ
jgi:signal transduction histidine kinase/ligand-binding sensor domain-containing protein